MDLDRWMKEFNISVEEMASLLEVNNHTVVRIKLKRGSPKLLMAFQIHYITKGKVTFEDMLGDKDEKDLTHFLDTFWDSQ